MSNLAEILTCPKCFEVKGCNSRRCQRECLDSCKYNAIFLKRDKAEIDILKCKSCSLCALACPFGAIDKAPLRKVSPTALLCPRCGTNYQKINNLYVLLPQNDLPKDGKIVTHFNKKIVNQELIDWKFLSYQYYVRYHKFIKYVNPIVGDDLVLDIGCASAPLSYNFKNYLGLDNSLKLVSFVSQHIDKPILLADARYIPLKNNSIPFFICRNLLEHTHEEMKIIYELRRVAQKGGFFEMPCSDQISWALDPINLSLKKVKFGPLKAFAYGYGHINMLSLLEWRKKLLKGGFKIVDSQDMGKRLILNLVSFFESLFLSYSDNDFIPTKLIPKRVYEKMGGFYKFLDKFDPQITKSWTKLFYVKV